MSLQKSKEVSAALKSMSSRFDLKILSPYLADPADHKILRAVENGLGRGDGLDPIILVWEGIRPTSEERWFIHPASGENAWWIKNVHTGKYVSAEASEGSLVVLGDERTKWIILDGGHDHGDRIYADGTTLFWTAQGKGAPVVLKSEVHPEDVRQQWYLTPAQ